MKLDQLMPVYDAAAAYEVRIVAPRQRVWNELMSADFSRLPVTRRLMTLRSLGRRKPHAERPQTLATFGKTPAAGETGSGGFLEIACVPEEEIVLGVIGRFWRPDAPLLREWKADDFARIAPLGQAKGAWNFYLEDADGLTVLGTETRVQCIGRAARIKFRLYWTLIGFFSGWIRKEMLRMVKRNSEGPPAPPVLE